MQSLQSALFDFDDQTAVGKGLDAATKRTTELGTHVINTLRQRWDGAESMKANNIKPQVGRFFPHGLMVLVKGGEEECGGGKNTTSSARTTLGLLVLAMRENNCIHLVLGRIWVGSACWRFCLERGTQVDGQPSAAIGWKRDYCFLSSSCL